MRSRRPPPCASHRPMIDSVLPLFSFQPYTLAVSTKLIPASTARSMIACDSFSSVCGPKFIVPRHRRLTLRPVRPSRVISMAAPGYSGTTVKPPEDLLPAGTHLDGRYVVQGRLGGGAMGSVYAATGPDGRRVAIKALLAA